MRFSNLPPRLRLLIVAQTTVAALILYRLWSLPPPPAWSLLVFLMVCGAVGGACKVDVNVRFGRLSLGFTVAYFAFLQLGATAGLLVGVLGTVAGGVLNLKEERRRVNLRKLFSCQTLFNSGNCVLATAAMDLIFRALGGTFGQVDLQRMGLPILASAAGYYLANTGGVTLAVAWSQGVRPRDVFLNHFAWSWPGFLAGACISAGVAWAYRIVGPSIQPSYVLLFPPSYLIYHLFKLRSDKINDIRELNRLNEAVIASLGMAIAAKDRHTGSHVHRVREYSVGLAERLGVPGDELQAIRIAALLHDMGKIGIPESILCKQGKLTPDEFEIVKSHVEIGAAILEEVQFPWPVVDVVRTHHERWDGLGYPQRLKGDEIPVGGRIISLVDVFDALTSDRPYRRAISREQAVEILRAGSGTQFDPQVVETFVRLLPEMDAAIAALETRQNEEGPPAVAGALARLDRLALPALTDDEEDALVLHALSDVLGQSTEIATLAPLLAERIAPLVPYSTFALFLANPIHRSLLAIHAAGLWTGLLDGMEIRLGEGVSGVVAATGEPVINAAASLDVARRVRPGDNLELNSTLSVPLRVGSDVVGAITVYHSSYNFYQPYHLRRLQRVARCAMQAVHPDGLLQPELHCPSGAREEDPASGLPNAVALGRFLHGQTLIAQSREEEFAVLILDVEELKEGRSGERLLTPLVQALQATVREGDYLARASETEFAVVLPRCGMRDAAPIARRLIERVRAVPGGSGTASPSLRVGMTSYPRDGVIPQDLLTGAARRLAPRLEIPRGRRSGSSTDAAPVPAR